MSRRKPHNIEGQVSLLPDDTDESLLSPVLVEDGIDVGPSVPIYERATKMQRVLGLISEARKREGLSRLIYSPDTRSLTDLERQYGSGGLYEDVLPGAERNQEIFTDRAKATFEDAGGYIALKGALGERERSKMLNQDWKKFSDKYWNNLAARKRLKKKMQHTQRTIEKA